MCLHDDVSSDNWTGKSRGHPFLNFQVGPVWAARPCPIRVFPSCLPPRHPPYGAAGVLNRPPGMVRRVFFSSFPPPRFAAQGRARFTRLWLNQLPVCVLFSGTNCPQTRIHPYPRAAASVRRPSTSPVTVHMHDDRQGGSLAGSTVWAPATVPMFICSYGFLFGSLCDPTFPLIDCGNADRGLELAPPHAGDSPGAAPSLELIRQDDPPRQFKAYDSAHPPNAASLRESSRYVIPQPHIACMMHAARDSL